MAHGDFHDRYVSAWSALASGRTIDRREAERLVADPADLPGGPIGLGQFSAACPHIDVLFDTVAFHVSNVLDPGTNGLPPLEDRGQNLAWSWSYTGRAAVLLWKATGQERFRNLFVDAARRVMALRDDRTGRLDEVQGRVVRSWGAPWPVRGETKRITDVTVTGLVSLPILLFANELEHDDPLVDEFAGYARDMVPSLWEFDRYFEALPGLRAGYYRSWLEPETFEALNHVHALAAAGAEIYRCTADKGVRDRLELLWNGFRHVTANDAEGAAYWPYIPDPLSSPRKVLPEAFWKSAVTLEFPLACMRAGILATDKDMRAFARMYSCNVLLPGDRYNVLIGLQMPSETYRWADPVGKPEYTSLLPFIFRGLWFSAYDPSLTPRLTGLLRDHPEKFPYGLLHEPFGVLTRAYLWPGAS